MKKYVKFSESGIQLNGSIDESQLGYFSDFDYREVAEGYVEGLSACKLVEGVVVLMSEEDFKVWKSEMFDRVGKGEKDLIRQDYRKRRVLGVSLYEDLQAEVVLLFKSGTDLSDVLALGAKFNSIVYGLNTGDFISVSVGLSSVVTFNDMEVDFKAYAVAAVNEVIADNGWL